MVRKRIEEVMQEKGVTKAEFARKWGCLPQNVNSLLETDNLKKLIKIAEVLECDVADFMTPRERGVVVNGYIEIDGVVHVIKSYNDFIALYNIIKAKS